CDEREGRRPAMSEGRRGAGGARPVGVGIIGSRFISGIHAESLRACPQAEIRAVAAATAASAADFARRFDVPKHLDDYRRRLAPPEIDMVVVGGPNDLHEQVAVDAAAAGKHVVMEKPLCLNLAEADRMIAACRAASVKLMYAEELCFTPKYVRLKQLVDESALGRIHLVNQAEKHDGPHAGWFWDVHRSGGGVTMDMGCHAIEFFRWLLGGPLTPNPSPPGGGERGRGEGGGKANVRSVYADMGTYVHGGKTRGDDSS